MKQKWFETWFNSKYYHILYKNRNEDEADAFIKTLINNLNLKLNARILDLACGKGRHSVILNKLGFDVTGVDLAEQSIEYAKQFENDTLTFYVHDMRTPLRVNYFDAILNLFTSFGYFENEKENEAVIKAAADQLKPNGLLVIDFFNAAHIHKCVLGDEKKTIDGICFHISKKIQHKHIVKNIRFTDQEKNYDYNESVQLLGLGDFEKYLSKHHFKTVHLFGNYQLQPFDEKTSDRLIVVAQKQNA